MKANLGGLGGIKQFFVAHGEKVGVVLVGSAPVDDLWRTGA